MGIATAIAFAVVSLSIVGLVMYLVRALVSRSDLLGDARANVAKLEGQLALSASETRAANDAVATIENARQRQLARAEALEKELNEVESDPTSAVSGKSGRDRLREALSRMSADPAGDQGDNSSILVPDRASDEAITARLRPTGEQPVTKP